MLAVITRALRDIYHTNWHNRPFMSHSG